MREKTVWVNIYRAGVFHRQGKPSTIDRHGGDFYVSPLDAIENIAPNAGYIATVSMTYPEPEDGLKVNPRDSVPVPLHVTRREFEDEQPTDTDGDQHVWTNHPEFR